MMQATNQLTDTELLEAYERADDTYNKLGAIAHELTMNAWVDEGAWFTLHVLEAAEQRLQDMRFELDERGYVPTPNGWIRL